MVMSGELFFSESTGRPVFYGSRHVVEARFPDRLACLSGPLGYASSTKRGTKSSRAKKASLSKNTGAAARL